MDQSSKILLVEGQDDKHVVEHLRRHLQPVRLFDIQAKDGIDNLLKAISVEIKAPGRAAVGAAVGIVADANDDPDARWQAVSDRLRNAGVDAPRKPSRGGTIMDGRPRVGVWLMPDNDSPGELEKFVQKMIPDGDPAWSLAREYVRGIPDEARAFPPGKRIRAELHAWLATREEPGFMGSAIGRGDLKTDGPLCAGFLVWMESLFR